MTSPVRGVSHAKGQAGKGKRRARQEQGTPRMDRPWQVKARGPTQAQGHVYKAFAGCLAWGQPRHKPDQINQSV